MLQRWFNTLVESLSVVTEVDETKLNLSWIAQKGLKFNLTEWLNYIWVTSIEKLNGGFEFKKWLKIELKLNMDWIIE